MATIIPLTFIIIVGVIKEAVVELKKWHDDKVANQVVYKKYKDPVAPGLGSSQTTNKGSKPKLMKLQSVVSDTSIYYQMFEEVYFQDI